MLTLFGCRAVYRTIELADGFNGKIIETEIWFSASLPVPFYPHLLLTHAMFYADVFDGLMVVFAMYTMNALHPVRLWRAHDVRVSQLPFTMKSSAAIVRDSPEQGMPVPLTM